MPLEEKGFRAQNVPLLHLLPALLDMYATTALCFNRRVLDRFGFTFCPFTNNERTAVGKVAQLLKELLDVYVYTAKLLIVLL